VARAGRVREGGLLLDDLLDNVGHPSADRVIERFQVDGRTRLVTRLRILYQWRASPLARWCRSS
jgi:hypothetical protein